MPNKVKFGISNLHFGTYEVNADGVAVLGAPFHLPGTVTLSLEVNSEYNRMHADNGVYWGGYSDAGYDGEIENALFTDAFKVAFLGYQELANGGCAQVMGAERSPVYIAFESSGDAEHRRGIIYNVDLGFITREYATTEDTAEPATATLTFTAHGDRLTDLIRVAYGEDSAPYGLIFTNPPAPIDITYSNLLTGDGVDLQTGGGDQILASVLPKHMLQIQRETAAETQAAAVGLSAAFDRNRLASMPTRPQAEVKLEEDPEQNLVLNDNEQTVQIESFDTVQTDEEEE